DYYCQSYDNILSVLF
nr:immunoglobulin light chain junction region [Macaca mulatta]